MSVNKAILVGHVGKDPNIRTAQSTGKKIASFSLASTESWRDRDTGERRKATEWHNIVVFNEGLVDVVEKYVRKGSRLYIEGKIKTRRYKGQDDIDRSVTEIVLDGFGSQLVLTDKREGGAPPAEGPGDYGSRPSLREEMNDEVPF